MINKGLLLLAVSALVLSGCVTDGTGPSGNQVGGAAIGAILGGLAGKAIDKDGGEGMIIGALVGAAAGAMIGTHLDAVERRKLEEASIVAAAEAPTGHAVLWDSVDRSDTKAAAAAPPPAAPNVPVYKPKKKPVVAAAKPATEATPKSLMKPTPASASRSAAPKQPSATGYVMPTSAVYRSAEGNTCRNVQQIAQKDGKTYRQDVTYCNKSGNWVAVA